MTQKKYRSVCLVVNSEGLVRTDMPDGSTQYLTEEAAIEIILQRIAAQTGLSLEEVKDRYGV